jgi:hypothetical protein
MSQSISRKFLGIFVIFGVFFVPLSNFYTFLEFFLALKINTKKTTLLDWVGPAARSNPPAPAPARLARPAKDHRCPTWLPA